MADGPYGFLPWDLVGPNTQPFPVYEPLRARIPGQPGYAAQQAERERAELERKRQAEEALATATADWQTIMDRFAPSNCDCDLPQCVARRIVINLLDDHKPVEGWGQTVCGVCGDEREEPWPCTVVETIRDA